MPGFRDKAEKFIIEKINELEPTGENAKLYLNKFKNMTDDEFDEFILGLENDTINLCVIAPNFSHVKLDTERNLNLGKKYGLNFFQKINLPPKDGLPGYLTPIPYLVIDLPVRRQAQILEKKIKIPEDNNSVDDFTGQPTGKSKGAKISYPESQVLAGLGLENSQLELIKFRGGDEKGFNAMNTMISRPGGVSLKAIEPFSGEVKSTTYLRAILNAMHLKNTL